MGVPGVRICARPPPRPSPSREMHVTGEGQIIAVRPYGTVPLGLAVDIGTTKLAAYLVDLNSGETWPPPAR